MPLASLVSRVDGLTLHTDGRIQLLATIFQPNDEVFGSLPGDWAVHKAPGVGQSVRCKRGDGTTREFRFDGTQWIDVTVYPLPQQTRGVENEPRQAPIASEDLRGPIQLRRDECFWGTLPSLNRTDIEFLKGGLVKLGTRTFGPRDDLAKHTWGNCLAYRFGRRKNFLLVVKDVSGDLVFLHDKALGWFELTKAHRRQLKWDPGIGGILARVDELLIVGVVTFGIYPIFMLLHWFFRSFYRCGPATKVCLELAQIDPKRPEHEKKLVDHRVYFLSRYTGDDDLF